MFLPFALCAGRFSGAKGLAARCVPWMRDSVRFEHIDSANRDVFELKTASDFLVIRASNSNAAAEGLGWHLRYYCHRSMNCLRNALTLITYWGGSDRNSEDTHDYASKAWSGTMTSYNLKRREMHFDYSRKKWDGADAATPDLFAWERQWVDDKIAARNHSNPWSPRIEPAGSQEAFTLFTASGRSSAAKR
jgi:hypothetical protein